MELLHTLLVYTSCWKKVEEVGMRRKFSSNEHAAFPCLSCLVSCRLLILKGNPRLMHSLNGLMNSLNGLGKVLILKGLFLNK